MAETVLLMGADMGDRAGTFREATRLISERAGEVLAMSRDHWTEPWGFSGKELFLNRALLVRTDLLPKELMHALLRIERELGRDRTGTEHYSSRPIDIDILLIGDEQVEEEDVTVPHPRMHERAFALGPAADIVPAWRHPEFGRTVLELLNAVIAKS